ncbi:MAG: hypothetical protein IPK26_14240 [Planctomycetes bacterium]|nr:hypothetical protein [Planctomycetota bacterium]
MNPTQSNGSPSGRSPASPLSLAPWNRAPLCLALVGGLVGLGLTGCTGGSKGDRDNRGDFKVTTISTGRGAIYPYRIREVDGFGNPTATVVNVESTATLQANVNGNNGVLPVATLSTTAELPDGNPGNHFLQFVFSHKLDVDSILSAQLASQTNSGLSGALNVLGYDPDTESTQTLRGRGFVNGYTYFLESGVLRKVKAVEADGRNVRILDSRANGFPQYDGAADLVGLKTFVFVADDDSDMTTFDTFPADRLLRLVVTNAVRDTEGGILEQEICTATTVGDDTRPPQVLGYTTTPEITPGRNQTGIDPTSSILVRFNKPVQPGEVGSFFDPQQFVPPSGGVTLAVTAAAQTFNVIYHADPVSYGDLCNYVITPAYALPGESIVRVTVQSTTIHSLTGQLIGTAVNTQFTTAPGQGIINAPVAPEALYVGIGGAEPGVSVIDLNGLGQGTGDLLNTRWPLNPNIGQPGVFPPLSPGTTRLDAGSGGMLTLVKDTNLNTRLLRDPLVGDITDIHVGPPLDLVFNNENINVNATRANQFNPARGAPAVGNTISQAPHPNPPRLVFPPPNPNRSIFGEEPTTTSSTGGGLVITTNPPCVASPLNLLVQGNPFSSQQGQVGIYQSISMGVFFGPQPPPLSPPPPTPFCPFTARQQVGHFLYVLDRDNRQVVVLNSNRFTVLDTIPLSDPVSMAMAPHMTRLAVTNFSSSSVSFIDIDPFSPTFNEVVAETRVERGPTGVCWQPDGEDVIVVSSEANFMTLISALDYSVRRSVSGFLNQPIEVVATPRYTTTGWGQGVYFAYVLNANGTIAVYESGPDGVNGIGFNDMIGTMPNIALPRARSILYDYTDPNSGLLIGHVDESGLGQISRLSLTTSPAGPQPLNPNIGGFIISPTYRQKEWTVVQRIGGLNPTTPVRDLLSGNSVIDLAVDEIYNNGGLLGQLTQFSTNFSSTPYLHSGKHGIKLTPNGAPILPMVPILLFVALSDVGKVDVFEVATGRRVTTIDVPGVRVLASYWRQ